MISSVYVLYLSDFVVNAKLCCPDNVDHVDVAFSLCRRCHLRHHFRPFRTQMAPSCKPFTLLRPSTWFWVCADIPAIPRCPVSLRYRYGWCLGTGCFERPRELAHRSPWNCEWHYSRRILCRIFDRRSDQPEVGSSSSTDLACALLDSSRRIVLHGVHLRHRARIKSVFESKAAREGKREDDQGEYESVRSRGEGDDQNPLEIVHIYDTTPVWCVSASEN